MRVVHYEIHRDQRGLSSHYIVNVSTGVISSVNQVKPQGSLEGREQRTKMATI